MAYTHSQLLEQQESEGELSTGEAAPARSAATVLVAEDDAAVRVFVNAVLEQAGYDVILAENGRKSLEICKNYQGVIDILVTDVVMPETNGRELAERAKLMRPDLKILFISGYVDRPIKDKDADDMCYGFLEKPFSAQSLVDAIAHFSAVSANVPR